MFLFAFARRFPRTSVERGRAGFRNRGKGEEGDGGCNLWDPLPCKAHVISRTLARSLKARSPKAQFDPREPCLRRVLACIWYDMTRLVGSVRMRAKLLGAADWVLLRQLLRSLLGGVYPTMASLARRTAGPANFCPS